LFEYRIAFLETYRNFVVLTTQNERSTRNFFVYRPFKSYFLKCNNARWPVIPGFQGQIQPCRSYCCPDGATAAGDAVIIRITSFTAA
jgi:hypothetical protein